MLVNAFYNLVDAYFVSGLGESQMGAISVVFPLGQVIAFARCDIVHCNVKDIEDAGDDINAGVPERIGKNARRSAEQQ